MQYPLLIQCVLAALLTFLAILLLAMPVIFYRYTKTKEEK